MYHWEGFIRYNSITLEYLIDLNVLIWVNNSTIKDSIIKRYLMITFLENLKLELTEI